ncbi:MAG: 3-phosphoglycerate dehydrogenase [Alphaproteobacteria bacterium]|nr:3-phosphoglycerate dehydrogenase [Alphaproteobacteria bacterium]
MLAPIVVLSEPLPAAGMARLAAAALELRVLAQPTGAALAAAVRDADAVVLVNERPALTAAMIAGAPRLRLACRNGAGFDNFDAAALAARGIPLLTTGAANADAVAEHALYLLLALFKRGPAYDRAVKGGAWPRDAGTRPRELRGKVAAIVGYGRIGRRIADLCRALGMRVMAVDPSPAEADVAFVPLPDALAAADAIILALPLSPATRGLIDAAALVRMKPSAFLVNVARGAIVDQPALAAALRAGRLAGAGLDVLAVEPPAADDPLLALDSVVLTPHVAASCPEAIDRVAIACADAVVAGLAG